MNTRPHVVQFLSCASSVFSRRLRHYRRTAEEVVTHPDIPYAPCEVMDRGTIQIMENLEIETFIVAFNLNRAMTPLPIAEQRVRSPRGSDMR